MSWVSPTEGSSAVPGMRLGDRYELVAPIASGGMAQVWSATDLDLNRDVAAKILHPHLATDDAFIERFRREAVAAARLSHRSIVSIYDTVSTGTMEAIVMELIDGRTLRAVLDEAGALPAADVIDIGMQIAGALNEAHSAGIVHRDIKPANIMVCPDRRVMVTDFGIAKAGTDADLTTTGTLLGTAKYLSPEQVRGEAVDPRSDLYSLGVVLFEALTGTAPFKANTDAATALARLHQAPPRVRQLRPNAPEALEAVVDRLMARDIRDRFPRADDVHRALAAVDPNAPPGPPISSAPTVEPYRPPDLPGAYPSVHSGAAVTVEPYRPPDLPGSYPSVHPGAAVTAEPYRPPARSAADAAAVTADPYHKPLTPGPGHPRPPNPPPRLTQGPPLEDASLELLGVERPSTARGGSASSGVNVSSEHVRRSGRSRWVAVAIVVFVIGALLSAGVIMTDVGLGGQDEPANPFDASGPGLTVIDVRSFDPQTSDDRKEENEALTALAIDGDPSTAWTTETYRRRSLGGLKDGVGLLLTIEEPLPLNQIELVTNTEDWLADIYVGDGFDDDSSRWGDPVTTIEAGSNRVLRDLGRAEGNVILLWIRDTGVSGERNRFELAEVVIR